MSSKYKIIYNRKSKLFSKIEEMEPGIDKARELMDQPEEEEKKEPEFPKEPPKDPEKVLELMENQ